MDMKTQEMLTKVPLLETSHIQVSEADAFKADLKQLILGARNLPGGRRLHMIKYDYSSVIPQGSVESGADCWDRVTMLGEKSGYYIPMGEGQIIYRNQAYFNNMFAEAPAVIDLGPGGSHSIDLKTIPVFRAVGGKEYVAIDLIKDFAQDAADYMGRKFNLEHSRAIVQDFSKPFALNADTPRLMLMFGSTITQFPFERVSNNGDATLGELLTNLGNASDHNAILVATIDANTHGPSAKDCYKGQHFDDFKRHMFLTAKALLEGSGDPSKNTIETDGGISPADAVVYNPRYENGGIVHSFITTASMNFKIDGESHILPQGTQLDTGLSQKWTVDEFQTALEKSNSGWQLVNVLTEGSSTVCALVLAGKNVSQEQLNRVAFDSLQPPPAQTTHPSQTFPRRVASAPFSVRNVLSKATFRRQPVLGAS